MAMTAAQAVAAIRTFVQDPASTLQGLPDGDYLSALNSRYIIYWRMERRVVVITLTAIAADDYLTNAVAGSSNIAEIVSVQRVVSNERVAVLERMEYNELRALQNYDATTGTPLRYAAYRDTASQGWFIALHPVPNAPTTINLIGTTYAVPLILTDTIQLNDEDTQNVIRMAAADCAILLGRNELVEPLIAPIPENIRVKMGLQLKRLDPKVRDEGALV